MVGASETNAKDARPARVEQTAAWLRLFIAPGQVTELRALHVSTPEYRRPHTVAGFFDADHLDDMARAAARLTPRATGVYFTPNPLTPDLLARRCNRVDVAETSELAADNHVLARRRLMVDADPVRVSGVSATDAEKALALEVVRAVRAFLAGRGWPAPVLADSGNGYHLLYEIDLPADDGGLVQRCLQVLASRFDTEDVSIDQKVFNPARIWKMYGTLSRKGDSVPGRPHRLACVLEAPAAAGPVPRDLLESLASELNTEEKQAAAKPTPPGGNGQYDHRLKVEDWLRDRGQAFRKKPGTDARGRTVYVLETCPFDAAHGTDACVMQDDAGKMFAGCFRNGCSGKGWQEFKEKIGKPDGKHYDPPIVKKAKATRKGTEAPSGAREAEDDPFRLARLFRDDHLAGGVLGLRYWREEFHAFDGAAYRAVGDKELRARLCGRIKGEYDRLAVAADAAEARKVAGGAVGDALQALASQCLVPGSVQTPAWLDGVTAAFPADELLVCRNVAVHLPAFVDGLPCRLPLTPRLFTANALDYAFDPDAPEPPLWVDFLMRLWPKDLDAVAALQEWFGYCLLHDTRQHKILMIVGPMRSGKGTIARVLRAVVGLHNTASPTLASLGTNFGLQPLLDKTLAVISDARLSGRTDVAQVVERLLSISGEDPQTVDRKYLPQVTAKLAVRFVILTNELPRLTDASGALVGRLIVLRQTESWYGREDTRLTDKLLGELPGILLWSMAGWKRLRDRGHFVQPPAAAPLIRDLEDLASPIRAFLRECCEVGPGREVHIQELFAGWQTWCGEKGRKDTGTEQTFGRDLRAAVPALNVRQPRGERSRIRVYEGIGLRTGE
jgi:putative DNA primase/helicase